MSKELPSDGACKPRSVLGDVTNQVGKRGFSSISIPGVKSGDGCKNDEGVQFAKKECIRVDNSKKENVHKDTSETNALKGNVIVSKSKIPCENKQPCSPNGCKNPTQSALKAGDDVRDSCISTQLPPTSPSVKNGPEVIAEAEEHERTDSVFIPQDASQEKVENSLGMDDGEDACLDNLDSSKDEYLDCSKLPESQESRCGFEKGIGQKGDGLSNMSIDSIKTCSCSFCMKAAYLWSDLHYQDIKGRIAVIQKSQKDASILVHKNNKDGAIGRYEQENSEKTSNLETDLTGRWMSLFLHVEDMFVREHTQLETSLSILKELRDSCCKADSPEK